MELFIILCYNTAYITEAITLTLRHLKLFTAVCDEGSVTKAAEKLYVSQPSVSLAIRELEEHYGVPLFDRVSKRLYITEAGKTLLDFARRTAALTEEAETAVTSSRRLRVGSSITVGTRFMAGYVKQFAQIMPDVKVFVTIASSSHIEEMILKNELDIAFIEGSVHDPLIDSQTYLRDNIIIIAPRGYRAAHENVTPESIFAEPFLLREKGSGTRELFDVTVSSLGFSANVMWESSSTEALINAVAAGLGLSALPKMLVDERVAAGDVEILDIDGINMQRSYIMIRLHGRYISEASKNFAAVVTEGGQSAKN